MKKSDLKTGMIVTFADDSEGVVIRNYFDASEVEQNIIIIADEKKIISLTNYNDDLIYEFDLDYDIIKVERPNNPRFTLDLDYERDKRTVLWERPEPVELTELEFCFLKVYGELGYTFIARDASNAIYAYHKKPVKDDTIWMGDVGYIKLPSKRFPFIKWEDEEPWNIAELLELSDYEVVRKGAKKDGARNGV